MSQKADVTIEQIEVALGQAYNDGYIQALRDYSWTAQGITYVGTDGVVLSNAINKVGPKVYKLTS